MHERRSTLIALAGLLALVLAMFGDLLFAGGTRVCGHQGADLFLQYYCWRDFGFHELAGGHLALWNPYIFGGAPYFGGMQSALLYLPNWLFLFLPVAPAVNWTVALNMFALGAFMFFWMRVRELSFVASFFAGALVMFAGPHFLHVFGGHLPQMATMTWSPLIFCAIDGLFKTRRIGWCLLGMFAVAMQVLAGFPQYVFYTGIVAGLYAGLRLIAHRSWRLAGELLLTYLGGAVLTAVQLWPGFEATGETVRGVRVPFEFARQCAFPPENFLTLLAGNLFGDVANYWGRCYLWETSLFLSVTGLVLAIYAAIYLNWNAKWISFTVILVALLLALGANTPLFAFLYEHVPGFDRFRATAKFIFPASLFVILLAASGLDRLLKQPKAELKFVSAVFAGAAALLILGFWSANTSSWPALMNWMQATHESYLRPELYTSSEFVTRAQHAAAISVLIAAVTCGIVGILLALRTRNVWPAYAIIALALVEMFVFARTSRATFDSAVIVNAQERAFLAQHPGDYRIINPLNPNSAMSLRAPDIWGYDPNVVRRYAEFVTWTQGGDPNNATLYVKFTHFDPLYAMLRLRYVFGQRGGELQTAEAPVPPMAHVQLISNYRVFPGPKIFGNFPWQRDKIFDAMRSPDFDPTREVILEREPDPTPIPGENGGTAKILNESTDALTIEADADQPSILLITDVYTPAWRAVSLPGSVQSQYRVLPANYILRAVPLTAGHHRLRVEYTPDGFTVGKWISIVSGVLFFGGVIANFQTRRGKW
jgi:hypothetical protein